MSSEIRIERSRDPRRRVGGRRRERAIPAGGDVRERGEQLPRVGRVGRRGDAGAHAAWVAVDEHRRDPGRAGLVREARQLVVVAEGVDAREVVGARGEDDDQGCEDEGHEGSPL